MAGAFREPRRADARRSWWRCSPNAKRTVLQVRFVSHGGLTPAAPDRMCVCVSQKSFFAGKRSHCNKSGGRKPPVGCTPRAGSRRRNPPHSRCGPGLQTHGGLTLAALGAACDGRVRMCAELSSQARFVEPRRADARRSWCCVRRSCGDVRGIVLAGAILGPRRADARRSWWRYSPNANRTDLQVRFVSHGGLTPAALGAACDGRVRMCAELSSQVRFVSHGGLMGAALVRPFASRRTVLVSCGTVFE
jgi:hypothetical protein